MKRLPVLFSTVLFLAIGFFSLNLRAQTGFYPKDIVKMVVFLDGEIIYDPDSSMTLEALEKVSQKDIASHRFIKEDLAVRLFGPKGKYGVFLMYGKDTPESKDRNLMIVQAYSAVYKLSPFKIFQTLQPGDTLIDCTRLRAGDVAPEFPGGHAEMQKFIADRLKLPDEARVNGITGRVTVGFIVGMNGIIRNVRAIYGRDLGAGLAAEATGIIKELPRFYPATRNGRPQDAFCSISIGFRISEQESPLEARQ